MQIENTADKLMSEGIAAARTGEATRARRALIEVTRLAPKSPDAWFWLGLTFDDIEKQIRCMKQVLALDSNHLGAHQALWHLAHTSPKAKQYITSGALSMSKLIEAVSFNNGDHKRGAALLNAAGDTPPHTATQKNDRPKQTRRPSSENFILTPSAAGSPKLLASWWRAILFNETAYEGQRSRISLLRALRTAVLLTKIIALIILIQAILPLSPNLAQLDSIDMARFVGETFLYGLFTGAQIILVFFISTWLAAYAGQERFDSDAGAITHFTLTGIWAVPVGLLFMLLNIGLWAVGSLFGGTVMALSVPATFLVFGIYTIGQFVHSSASIHRVSAGPAIMLAGVQLIGTGLVLAWIFPFTLALPLG